MTQALRPQDAQITIETVIFNLILQLGGIAGNLRTTSDPGTYLVNADNMYWLSRTLWETNKQYITDEAQKERNEILKKVQEKYRELSTKEGKKLVIRDKGQVCNLTAHLSVETLRILMNCLHRRGLIKERKAFAVAGEQFVKILEDGTVVHDEVEGLLPDGPE